MITKTDWPFGKEFNEFIGEAFLKILVHKNKVLLESTYDDVKREFAFHFTDGTIDKFLIIEVKEVTANCIIDQEDFKKLKTDSEILDKNGRSWTVVLADCGGPGEYPRHLFRDYLGEELYIHHNGEHMCFDKAVNICGAFEKS